MNKTLVIILIIATSLIIAAVLFLANAFGTQMTAIRSIRRIGHADAPLYYMEYNGDYGFDRFLEQGGATSDDAVAVYLTDYLSHGMIKQNIESTDFACSTLSAVNAEGETVFGRNFDWDYCVTVIIRTRPKEGYASLSTCNLNFVSGGKPFDPQRDIVSGMLTIGGIYVPQDGINEKGLAVADLVIDGLPEKETHQNRGRTPLTTSTAIRLLLDRAATVDEALALLEQYDMHSSAGMVHHLSIADASGRSVVVEFFGDSMYVTETPAVTNFVMAEHEYKGMGTGTCHERYEKLMAAREAAGGIMSEAKIACAMESVKETTAWTTVCNLEKLTYKLYFRGDFSVAYEYSLSADSE